MVQRWDTGFQSFSWTHSLSWCCSAISRVGHFFSPASYLPSVVPNWVFWPVTKLDLLCLLIVCGSRTFFCWSCLDFAAARLWISVPWWDLRLSGLRVCLLPQTLGFTLPCDLSEPGLVFFVFSIHFIHTASVNSKLCKCFLLLTSINQYWTLHTNCITNILAKQLIWMMFHINQ